jgi:hypothetical protein
VITNALQRVLGGYVYVQVFKDRIWLRDLQNGRTIEEPAARPFSTRRLLVGDFAAAQAHLKELFRRLYAQRTIPPRPCALIQARELTEGGLSPVEERVLLELAEGAGASRAIIHDGSELTDQAALERLGVRPRGA